MTKREHDAICDVYDTIEQLRSRIRSRESDHIWLLKVANSMYNRSIEEIRNALLAADECEKEIALNKRILAIMESEYIEAENE